MLLLLYWISILLLLHLSFPYLIYLLIYIIYYKNRVKEVNQKKKKEEELRKYEEENDEIEIIIKGKIIKKRMYKYI